VPNVARTARTAAFASEAEALLSVTRTLTERDLTRISSCPPWTAGELLGHVVLATGRIRQALAEPADSSSRLVGTAGYYRPDERFSPAANADRIQTASRLTAALGSPAAISAELGRVSQDSLRLLTEAPDDRTVRTRHGDRMLLTDFACTRIVELGVHGLDLAVSLDRPPWLTSAAADVLDELLLPGGQAARLRDRLGCDQVALIGKLTGRMPVSPAEQAILRESETSRLTLG
jgi:uncharacterized protein (TIGR03083 family)